jgi:phosphatidylserine synthase
MALLKAPPIDTFHTELGSLQRCRRNIAIALIFPTSCNVVCASMTSQNAFVPLGPKSEQFLWIVSACGAGGAFLTSRTFYVRKGTFARGAVLLGVTAFLSYLRFRRRRTPRTKSLTVTSNTVLVLLGLLVALFLLGVASWYE